MRILRILPAALLLAVLLLVLGALGFVFSGFYDVAATEPHWPATRWALDQTRLRSIRAHAAGIVAPPALDDPARVQAGVEHFAAHCAVCHGAPGVPRGEIAEGLYPLPPSLAGAANRYSPGELFWILKHGIKMTGMPAWNRHSDDELWATVAFLRKLPTMSEQDYAKLLVAGMAGGGHHHGAGHGGGDAHGDHGHGAAPPDAPEHRP